MTSTRLPLAIAVDHPAFAGHFPGRPLLPGVALLSEVLAAVRANAALSARLGPAPVLASAKFLAPVGPGAALTITLHDEPRALRFELHDDERLAASGQWQVVDAAAASGTPSSPSQPGPSRAEADR